MEATLGVEPRNGSFAGFCLTTWLCRHLRKSCVKTLQILQATKNPKSILTFNSSYCFCKIFDSCRALGWWCPESDLNRHGSNIRGILSPLCLPFHHPGNLSKKNLSKNLCIKLNESYRSIMERETGFEPATPTLARLCSTTELFPHICQHKIKKLQVKSVISKK